MKLVAAMVGCTLVMLLGCSSRGGARLGTVRPTSGSLTQNVSGQVAAYRTIHHRLSIPRAGTMRLVLTWDTPAVDLELYLASASCSRLYPTSQCGIAASSKAALKGVEELTRPVTAGEKYSIFVDNLDPKRPQRYTLSLIVQ